MLVSRTRHVADPGIVIGQLLMLGQQSSTVPPRHHTAGYRRQSALVDSDCWYGRGRAVGVPTLANAAMRKNGTTIRGGPTIAPRPGFVSARAYGDRLGGTCLARMAGRSESACTGRPAASSPSSLDSESDEHRCSRQSAASAASRSAARAGGEMPPFGTEHNSVLVAGRALVEPLEPGKHKCRGRESRPPKDDDGRSRCGRQTSGRR